MHDFTKCNLIDLEELIEELQGLHAQGITDIRAAAALQVGGKIHYVPLSAGVVFDEPDLDDNGMIQAGYPAIIFAGPGVSAADLRFC